MKEEIYVYGNYSTTDGVKFNITRDLRELKNAIGIFAEKLNKAKSYKEKILYISQLESLYNLMGEWESAFYNEDQEKNK